ncbi:MAG: hypothetical protein NTX43_07360 [Bacteroidetes bacterium]|nr:hypothetical protein [Bacteroidota bacterium]
MKKNILHILILTLLIAVSCTGIYYYYKHKVRTNTNDFVLALADKTLILQNTKAPRIVFVGGSNLVFGVDSKRVADSTGLPVVNMSMLGGYGLTFMLNGVRPGIRKGDILILSFEYFLGEGEMDLLAHTVDMVPAAYSYLNSWERRAYPLAEAKLRLKQFVEALQRVAQFNTGWVEEIYRRDGFNSYGDVISHLEKPTPKVLGRRFKIEATDYSYYIGLINEFAAYARSRGATLYYLYPDYPRSEFKKYFPEIISYDQQMRQSLNIPILNKVDTFIYDDEYFFDTVYHLNKQGREMRTNQLISILLEYIRNRNV